MVDHDISGRSAGDHGARDKPPRRLAARRVEPEVEMKQRRGTTTRSTTMKHTLMLLIAPLALAGCQTIGPTWSELSGDRYYNTTMPDRLATDRPSLPRRRESSVLRRTTPGPRVRGDDRRVVTGASRRCSTSPD